MSIGRRCAMGCATWPDETTYLDCPICRKATKRYRGADPMTPKAALSAKKYADFDHYYETVHQQDTAPITNDELKEMGIVLKPSLKAVKAAQNICRNLEARKSLGDAWNEIAPDIKEEIEELWVTIIQASFD